MCSSTIFDDMLLCTYFNTHLSSEKPFCHEDMMHIHFQQEECGKKAYAFYAIFDGEKGTEAAAFAREHLHDEIVKQDKFWSDDDNEVIQVIKHGFISCHLHIARKYKLTPISGTRASVVIIRNKKVYCANVGDSTVIYGGAEHGIKGYCLSTDHKRQIFEEITDSVMEEKVHRVVWDESHKNPSTVIQPRCPLPACMISRSLGDLSVFDADTGVRLVPSPTPDVNVLELDPFYHKSLVLASNGIWNTITHQMCIKYVHEIDDENRRNPFGATKNPAELMVRHAQNFASAKNSKNQRLMCIVIMIGPTNIDKEKSGAMNTTFASITVPKEEGQEDIELFSKQQPQQQCVKEETEATSGPTTPRNSVTNIINTPKKSYNNSRLSLWRRRKMKNISPSEKVIRKINFV